MTEQEAIEVITKLLEQSENIIVELTNIKEIAESQQKVGEYYANLENCVKEMDACKVAIKALEEVEQYRAIGTPEECRAAKEVKKEITEIVNRQLIAGKDNYKETYNCFYEIVKIIQDNY